MIQYQLFCYCLSKEVGVGFFFQGLCNLTHWQYYGIDSYKFSEDVNNFFNLPSDLKTDSLYLLEKRVANNEDDLKRLLHEGYDVIVDVDPVYLMMYGQKNILNIDRNRFVKDLLKNVAMEGILKYFDYSLFNISVHIRRFTKTDCTNSFNRDLFDESKKEYYLNLLRSLSDKYKNRIVVFHIYSQGSFEDFLFLLNVSDIIYKNHLVKLHIDEYPLVSLYHMLNSDVFVMANSAFSYIVHLYRDGVTYKKVGFPQVTYKDVRFIQKNGVVCV